MMDFIGPVLELIIRMWDCCACVREFEENLSCLRDIASDLRGVWIDVSVRVEVAEAQYLRRLNEVNDWLDKVEAMQTAKGSPSYSAKSFSSSRNT